MKSITKQRKGTKKHIAKTCLEVYEKVLEEGKKDNLERFKKRLRKKDCDYGICKLYKSLDLIDKDFYKIINFYSQPIHSDGSLSEDRKLRFWFKIPYRADSKKEAVDLIKKRMEILKKW